MKIAILMPARNSAKTIKKSLDSIVRQTFFQNPDNTYDIYLIDNMSDDELCNESSAREYLRDYKNIIYMQCDVLGIGPPLNMGIFSIMQDKEVEYIFRLDPDDIWILDKVQIQVDYLVNNKDIDICGTGMNFVDLNGNFMQSILYWEEDKDIKQALLNGCNPIAHPSVAYKKKIFLFCGGYNQFYEGAEDLDLWIRCSKKFKFYNIQKPLVNYSFNPKSQTSRNKQAEKLHSKMISWYE